jgi:hypothetical protein
MNSRSSYATVRKSKEISPFISSKRVIDASIEKCHFIHEMKKLNEYDEDIKSQIKGN